MEMVSARGAARAVRGLDGTQVWGKQVFEYKSFRCSGKLVGVQEGFSCFFLFYFSGASGDEPCQGGPAWR